MALTHIHQSFLTKTATYTLTLAENIVLANGTFTLTLPTAASANGRPYTIKNIGTGVVTVDANGTETIDGALTFTLDKQNDVLVIASNGTAWHRIVRMESFASINVAGISTFAGNVTMNGTRAYANGQLRCDTTNGRLVIPVGTGKYAT